ncbi:MAG: hypothetical protein ACH36H_12835 [Candidatus Nanopelagicales bacterium]
MTSTICNTQVGDIVVVDIADTVGQSSAIEANGGSVFTVKVTWPAERGTDGAGEYNLLGFGRVLGTGPVAGHEVGFTVGGVQ